VAISYLSLSLRGGTPTKQSRVSLRHCEEQSDEAILLFFIYQLFTGLPRPEYRTRNDERQIATL